jgi:hypothetical protein
MKNKILFIMVLGLMLLFPPKVFASELCSPNGYTILTINGMLANETDAKNNSQKLALKFNRQYNNELLKIDYLYNATHLAGIGDTVDILAQGILNKKSGYDLTEILKDASKKTKTQKVLLVAHSQGNFYANNFYDKVADKEDGIPSESIEVYGVATPDNRVAGNGKYLTSDTDTVINYIADAFFEVLPPNVHISLKKTDGDGHSFSNVYMKYQGDRVVSDIKSLLNKLETNEEQNSNEPCISAPELSIVHNTLRIIFAVVDPVASVGKYIANGAENTGIAVGKIFNKLLASAGGSVDDTNNSVPISDQEEVLVETEVALANESENKETISNVIPEVNNTNAPVEEENETEEILKPVNPDVSKTIHQSNSGNGPEPTQKIVLPVVDTTIPIISLLGEGILNITKDSVYVDAGATAFDEVDKDLTNSIIKGGTFVDTTIIGIYTITYSVKDLSNNPAVIVIRTINIIAPESLAEDDEEENDDEEEENNFIIDKDTILTYGEYNYDNLLITNKAKLTLESNPNSLDIFKGVKINAKNITIDSGSYISADNQGYNKGPGSPSDQELSAGSTYGGAGLRNTSTSKYGSAVEPVDLGSGGINNYRGGGAVMLFVEESILNNGIISANGDISSSGGSVYIKAKSISGNGNISANGGGATHIGSDTSGTGGGGRIALYYEDFSLAGKVEALGWCAQYDGFSMTCASNGTVGFFDTVNNNLLVNSFWAFEKNDSSFDFNKIILTDKAIVTSEEDTTINANELLMNETSQFTLGEDQIINIPIISLDDSSKIIFSGEESITSDTLTLSGNATATVISERILTLEIPNIIIENGSSISVDTKGYKNGLGTPIGQDFVGASYGGLGGNNTTAPTYGDEMEPIDFGSGGYQEFHGGGAIRLIVTDTLLNNGLISAMGDVTSSGGSIYITAKNISGSGTFNVNGGGAYCGSICIAPGGGGRMAIYYKDIAFTGKTEALGGWGSFSGWAGSGTVKMVDEDDVISDSEPVTVYVLPTIESYTFNGVQDNITINPLINNLSIIFNANKKIDWVYIKIVKEDDSNVHKKFFDDGDYCTNGASSCTKVWNGLLSSGGLLQNGIYKVWVHIKDTEGKEYQEYLPSIINVNIQ